MEEELMEGELEQQSGRLRRRSGGAQAHVATTHRHLVEELVQCISTAQLKRARSKIK
jgi:hypothetical protein